MRAACIYPCGKPRDCPNRDLRRLLRAVHASGNLRDIAIVEVLAGTGLRVGELLALQVGDVEIGERSGKLTVRKGKHGGYRARAAHAGGAGGFERLPAAAS